MAAETLTGFWMQVATQGWPIAIALVLQLVTFRMLKATGRASPVPTTRFIGLLPPVTVTSSHRRRTP